MHKKKTDADARNAWLVADQLLNRLISKADYNHHVIYFMHNTWKLVLCNVYLTQGKSSSHWGNLKKITSMLFWSLRVKSSVKSKRKLVESLPSLLHALSRGMDLIQTESAQKDVVFQMLAIEHAKIIRKSQKFEIADADTNKAVPPSSENAIHSMDDFSSSVKEGEIQFDDNELIELVKQQVSLANEESSNTTLQSRHPQSLKIGSWVNFDPSGTINKVGELFWKSRVTGKCVFLNEKGHKIVTIDEGNLDTDLKSGKAALTKSCI